MQKIQDTYDYLIIGAGIIGMSLAHELKKKYPKQSIAILEKEKQAGQHASGRNSGVLHAGFYYSSDSLKARLCVEGNRMMKEFCKQHDIAVNNCGKVVVAKNKEELQSLYKLERRGIKNGVDVKLISLDELKEIEPLAKSFGKALHSPTTASVDPKEVCKKLQTVLTDMGVEIWFNAKFKSASNNVVITSNGSFKYEYLINAAGLYADAIAKQFGFSKNKVIIPFKGNYLKYSGNGHAIKTNIYPVPNLLNPFLGVHYTVTAKNELKLGPTSTPAFWRENYNGLAHFRMREFLQIAYYECKLFLLNSFNFRSLAISEIKKYNKGYFVQLANHLSHNTNGKQFKEWTPPGIRAQLLNTKTLKLEMDFVVEGDQESLHILNAVSPAFTCSFAFAKYLIEEKIEKLNPPS